MIEQQRRTTPSLPLRAEIQSPTQAAEDLFYALLMSTEFATNH
jgi:hypothetical protein